MAFDVHERSTGSESSVHLIDLTEEEQEAPFAVREADGSAGAVPGRIPDKAEILAWLEEHPVFVGIATGVLCFSIIAGAMSAVLGSDPQSGDPVAGAALSDTDGGQGSFSSSGSGGANFTSDESKLSRTGAGRVPEESADGETAAGPSNKPKGQSANDFGSTDPTTVGTSNLDQSATLGGRTPTTGNGSGQPAGPASSATGPAGTNSNVNPDRSGSPITA
ncbi:MAG: hypothetical protein OEW83_16785, partial [Acidimicrobiia bacterium]|nr:hypothetical protein [Acidimicrobiia bacterium]